MPTVHTTDGVNYIQTSVLVREDLHAEWKKRKFNLSALVNAALEQRLKK